MERLPDVLNQDGTITVHFRDEEEGTHLSVQITYEGVIMDAYSVDEDGNDHLAGTVGRMASEWWEYLTGIIPSNKAWLTDHLSVPTHGRTEAQDGE